MPESGLKRDIENEADLMATLPDELLCEIFSYLFLHDVLRSESVNKKFQRCVGFLLNNKPQILDISLEHLNGYYVPVERFAHAVRAYAAKAKFSHIMCTDPTFRKMETPSLLDSIISALNTNQQCLSQVNSVHLDIPFSSNILEEFLAKCGKLNYVKLHFGVQPLNNAPDAFSVDLAAAFSSKAITRLELPCLAKFSLKQLMHLFCALKPNTLRRIVLSLADFPPNDILALIKDLADSAWAALEEMKLLYVGGDIPFAEFVAALADLTKLRKCEVELDYQVDQFIHAMLSLFNNSSQIATQCKAQCTFIFHDDVIGCELVKQIGQTQINEPTLQVVFTTEKFILKHGNVTFENTMLTWNCDLEDCVQCHSFYHTVLDVLVRTAFLVKNARVEDYQLDSCKIDTIVEHVNERYSAADWKALSAVTDAEGTVTIDFKLDSSQKQFSISIRSGCCFSSSCIQCVNVD